MIEAARAWLGRWADAREGRRGRAVVVAVYRWMRLLYVQLDRDKAFVRAAGLAYTTLVALVPLLLLVFGIVHALGLAQPDPQTGKLATNAVENLLFGTVLADLPEVRDVLLPGLRQVDLTALSLAGLASLLLVAGRLYVMTEVAYNDIFGVPVVRAWYRRAAAFLGFLLLIPALVLAGTLGSQWIGWEHPLQQRWVLGTLQGVALLTALKLLPCTRVRWRPALVGAGVSGVALELLGRVFPLYVSWFASDDPLRAVYGSLALLPVFLLWLYLLWVCVLVGVEIAYVAQNTRSLLAAEREAARWEANPHTAPSTEAAVEVGVRLAAAGGRAEVDALAASCGLSARDVRAVARVLEDAGMIGQDPEAIWLARSPDAIRLGALAAAYRSRTSARLGRDPLADALTASLHVDVPDTLAEAARPFPAPR